MRSFGQGVIVAEQIPTKIAADVIKNTNTKIIHRLVSSDDQLAIGASLGIPEADRHYLNQLATGFALVHKEGMARPIEVCINNTTSNRPVGDDLIAERWRDPLEADPRGLQLSRQDLEMQLFLHESGLLDDSFVASTARRLLNSVMISNYEVGDLIPDALRSVRSCHRNEYLQDSTIIRALEHWFARVLLAPVLDLGCGKMPSPEVIEGISRLWNEPHEFNRERLIHRLDMWRGSTTVERLREFAAITVLKEVAGQPEEANLKELADRELLVVDHIASEAIRDTIRQRLL
jgi:hypothetical protein